MSKISNPKNAFMKQKHRSSLIETNEWELGIETNVGSQKEKTRRRRLQAQPLLLLLLYIDEDDNVK